MSIERDIVADQLAEAEHRLAVLEGEVDDTRLLLRLRAENDLHLALLGYHLNLFGMALFVALAIAAIGLPLLGRDVMQMLGSIDLGRPVPTPLVLLAVGYGLGMSALGFRGLALMRARQSPRLPDEAAVYSSVARDIARARTELAVLSAPSPSLSLSLPKLTPRPALRRPSRDDSR